MEKRAVSDDEKNADKTNKTNKKIMSPDIYTAPWYIRRNICRLFIKDLTSFKFIIYLFKKFNYVDIFLRDQFFI